MRSLSSRAQWVGVLRNGSPVGGGLIHAPSPLDCPNNLELHIYDKDPLLSDYLGSVTFDIALLQLNDTKEITYVCCSQKFHVVCLDFGAVAKKRL
jgi:hypothetical protein